MSYKKPKKIIHTKKGNIAYYTQVLTKLLDQSKYSQAFKIISEMEEEYAEDQIFNSLKYRFYLSQRMYEEALACLKYIKYDNFYISIAVALIKVLSQSDKYDEEIRNYYEDELRKIYDKFFQESYALDIADGYQQTYYRIHLYLKKYFNDNIPEKDTLDWRGQQIIYYDEQLVIDKAIAQYTRSSSGNKSSSFFRDDINIEELIKNARRMIENNKDKAYLVSYREYYRFYLSDCGTIHGIPTNYFLCEVNYNTSEILFIMPTLYNSNPEIDYQRELSAPGLKKSRSGLERFNERYNKR